MRCVCLSWASGREPGRQTDRTENRTNRKENKYILSLIAWHGKPNATTVVVRLQYYCSTVPYTVVLYPYPCTPPPPLCPMPMCHVCVVLLLCCCVDSLSRRRRRRPEGRSPEGKGRSPTEGRKEKKKKKIIKFFIFFFLCVWCVCVQRSSHTS